MDENTASTSTRDLSARQLEIDFRKIFESAPALFLLLGVDETVTIVDASDGYLRATYTERDQIVGRSLFEVFPDNPDDQAATGVTNLRASLQRVLATGRPDTMAVQRYDVRRPSSEGGGFEERHWSCVNAPVLGPDGRLLVIIHRVEDVTELADTNRALTSEGEALRLGVMARGHELQEANRQLREVTEQCQAMYDQGLFAARLRLVADNGAGIAPELLSRVFDLFVQSERTLDRAQGGLGIGLAVVKRLIEMHGGEINVRSAGLGHGSTFEIRLPPIARPAKAAAASTSLKSEPRRVLVVDDRTRMPRIRFPFCWRTKVIRCRWHTAQRMHSRSLKCSGRTWACSISACQR